MLVLLRSGTGKGIQVQRRNLAGGVWGMGEGVCGGGGGGNRRPRPLHPCSFYLELEQGGSSTERVHSSALPIHLEFPRFQGGRGRT